MVPNAEASREEIICDRPFKCTCCCLCRPVIRVSHPALGDLCEVYNPCGVFHQQFIIRKPTLESGKVMPELSQLPDEWYTVRAHRCQPGACFACPSG